MMSAVLSCMVILLADCFGEVSTPQ